MATSPYIYSLADEHGSYMRTHSLAEIAMEYAPAKDLVEMKRKMNNVQKA